MPGGSRLRLALGVGWIRGAVKDFKIGGRGKTTAKKHFEYCAVHLEMASYYRIFCVKLNIITINLLDEYHHPCVVI